MAVFEGNAERDREGVYILADEIAKIGPNCAYGVVEETLKSNALTFLAAKAVEGVAYNAIFAYDLKSYSIFTGSQGVVLHGPVYSMFPTTRTGFAVRITNLSSFFLNFE